MRTADRATDSYSKLIAQQTAAWRSTTNNCLVLPYLWGSLERLTVWKEKKRLAHVEYGDIKKLREVIFCHSMLLCAA